MSYSQVPGQFGQGPPGGYGGPTRPPGPDQGMYNGQPPTGMNLPFLCVLKIMINTFY